VAAKVIAIRGVDASDAELMAIVEKRVGAALRTFTTREQAESRHGPGLTMVWRLVE
jgi:hypothetical protein